MEGAVKFTVQKTDGLKLPSGKSDHIEFDDDVPGLGLRLREGGSRTWVFQYKLGSKQRRMALGSAKAITLGKARETAKDLHAAVRLGRDPAGEKNESKVRAGETFGAIVQRFLARQKARLKPRSYVEVERHLLVHGKQLHGSPIAAIDRRAIASRLGSIAESSGAVTANRVRASLSAFFSWAIKEGLLDANPASGTNRQEEKSRNRVLSDAEIKVVWGQLDEDDDYGDVIRLLTLTGQRADEIASLRWSEIRDGNLVELPPERTKNGRLHTVPLAEPARAILAARHRRSNADGTPRDLVFGIGEGPFSGWSRAKESLDERIAKAASPLPHWTVHDLRRTVATRMAELGVAPHVIEAVLNHVSGHKAGIAGIYNRSTYEREKRIALDLWSNHVLAVVKGRKSNVTPLKRA
jgi:integrase